jgi:AhpD family alkylhydroperoxidase
MPRITAIDPHEATARVKPLFDTVQKLLGATPNMMRTMAQSPAVLEGYLGLLGALAKGSLGGRIGEQIALLTAEENGCTYCAAAHTALGLGGGLTEDDVSAARLGSARDPRADAALTLARAILESRGHIADADVDAARQAGLTDGQIAEVVAHVALNVFTNYFNTVAGTEVDFPAVRAPRLPAAARQSAAV